MPTDSEYKRRIQVLDATALRAFWDGVEARDTPGWDAGKGFEYGILRAFELEGAEVQYPYSVYRDGELVEQIDGVIHLSSLSVLAESKDYSRPIDIAPVTKLRNQLSRRPAATIGAVFSARGFTAPARILSGYIAPQTILLWDGAEVGYALRSRAMIEGMLVKYRRAVERGQTDYNLLRID